MRPTTLQVLSVVAASTALLGCPNPNTYGTPRTIPAGKDQHTIAAEGIYATAKSNVDAAGNRTSASVGLPMFPTYQYRRGIADEVDFGVRVANLSSLGGDVKWNFVKGDVDIAIDPGLQWFGVFTNNGSVNLFYFHGPLLVGINASDDVAVVLTPGFVYALAVGSISNSSGQSGVFSGGGALARLGLGLNLRLGKTFAIMPEVTAMKGFNDAESLLLVGGLGFKIGAQPYSDSEIAKKNAGETAPATPPPPPGTPGAPAPAPAQ
jgi:hypothetical protein